MRVEFDDFAIDGGAGEYFPGSLLTRQAEFGDNPGKLRMFRYVPPNAGPGAPLLVILHGCLQSARGYDHGAGWSALAGRFGFALLAPEQSRVNNPNGCFNWFLPESTTRGLGEAASIHQMIEAMLHENALDRRRVFITGLSAGGAMAGAVLAAYPETFAGGAIIAGLPYGAATNLTEALIAMHRTPPRPAAGWGEAVRNASPHRGPWPRISLWHGDADNTVAPANMEALSAQWLEVHRLSEPPQEKREAGLLRRVWHDKSGRPILETYSLQGLGHGVPIRAGTSDDAAGEAGPFVLEAGISSSHRIAEFFGLTRPAQKSRAAKPTMRKEKVIARAAVALAEPEPQALEIAAAPDGTDRQARPAEEHGGRLRRIITEALRAAGLVAKD